MNNDKRRIGRPMKYDRIIDALDNETLYTAGCIATFAEEKGMIEGRDIKKGRLRIRISMGRLASNHLFPKEGDGLVEVWGQSIRPGWHGRRWKQAADPFM